MSNEQQIYFKRLTDPLVVIAALTAIITVVFSYASLNASTMQVKSSLDDIAKQWNERISANEQEVKNLKELTISRQDSLMREDKADMDNERSRMDAISNRVLVIEQTAQALAKTEADRVAEHTQEWQRQVDRNSALAADLDGIKESIAVLRAELDGSLITRAHPLEETKRPSGEH